MSSLGVAIVTGAAQGIGRAISLRLANDGFHVAVNDLQANSTNLEAIATEIAAMGRRTMQIIADVSDEEQVRGMITDVVRDLGGLDVMVANAGTCRVGTLLETDLDNWDSNFAVNVKGTFLCFKYAAKQMIAQGRGGRLIGASSVAGKIGRVNLIAYSSSKFAVRGLVQCAALELGRHGITVNSYAPGPTMSPMLESIKVANEEREESSKVYQGDYYKTAAEKSAMGCLGKPEDVANVVSFLSSKVAHHITGQSFSVDGGVSLS